MQLTVRTAGGPHEYFTVCCCMNHGGPLVFVLSNAWPRDLCCSRQIKFVSNVSHSWDVFSAETREHFSVWPIYIRAYFRRWEMLKGSKDKTYFKCARTASNLQVSHGEDLNLKLKKSSTLSILLWCCSAWERRVAKVLVDSERCSHCCVLRIFSFWGPLPPPPSPIPHGSYPDIVRSRIPRYLCTRNPMPTSVHTPLGITISWAPTVPTSLLCCHSTSDIAEVARGRQLMFEYMVRGGM